MNGKQGDSPVRLERGSRNYSSLPRQLPSAVQVPYGYKLDLDFVRFCNSFYDSQGNNRTAHSQLRKMRRSHKKSYNSLLGLHHVEKADRPKPVSPKQLPERLFPSLPHRTDNKLASDLERSLGEVVSDFEDTLHRSRGDAGAGAGYFSDSGSYRPRGRRFHSLPRSVAFKFHREPSLPRGTSTSSLSDSSPTGSPPRPAPPVDYAQQMAETIASLHRLSQQEDYVHERRSPAPDVRRSAAPDVRSGSARQVCNSSSGRNSAQPAPAVPQNSSPGHEKVTTTMAGHLPATRVVSTYTEVATETSRNEHRESAHTQRIRELEEQVKAIPMLKHKLSVLREEKRSMENLLRSRPRREGTPDQLAPDSTEQSSRVSLRSRSLSPSQDAPLPVRRVQQDAATSCHVLTRDVGVCGSPLSRDHGPQSDVRVRAVTRDCGVGGGPSPAPDPVQEPPPVRSVGVLTELHSVVKQDQERRPVSLESILSGRRHFCTRGTNTPQRWVSAGGKAAGDDAAQQTVSPLLERLQVEERDRGVGAEKRSSTAAGIERGCQTRAADRTSSGTATDPPPPTRDNHSATDPAPKTRHTGTITAAAPRRPATRDAALTTELTLDELRSADELRMQVEELHSQLDELRELHRASRCSSETRDTFTQIKEYDLGVNYTRGAFAFHKSSSCGMQTDPVPAAVRGVSAQAAPAVLCRTFAAQVRPATASVGVQCQRETQSSGTQARPDTRDVCVFAEHRRHTRSVAAGTDPPAAAMTSGQVGRSPVARHDAGTCTLSPSTVSRAVVTDKPREILKKAKTTMTDVTPLRSVASGEHLSSRHQASQTATAPATPAATRHTSCQTSPAAVAEDRPPSERLAQPTDAEPQLPPVPRANGVSRIPRLTPTLTRKASAQSPPALTRAASDLSASPPCSPLPVRRTPATTSLPRAVLTPPTVRKAAGKSAASAVRSSAAVLSGVRREKSAPVLTPPRQQSPAKQPSALKSPRSVRSPAAAQSVSRTAAPAAAAQTPSAARQSPSVLSSTNSTSSSAVSLSSPAQAAVPSPPQVAALSPSQVAALSPSQVAALSPSQVAALSSSGPSGGREPAVAAPAPGTPAEAGRQPASAEPKQRQFGRRDTFVAREDAAANPTRDERGQGDTPERRLAPLADEDTFSSDEERIAAECLVEGNAALAPRTKVEPTAEMRAALKVLHDALATLTSRTTPTSAVQAADTIVQSEWFRVAGTRGADPHAVEDYLDVMETVSPQVLSRVVNMADNNKNTAMHYAVSHGNFDVVSVLLDSRVCDVQRQNAAGYTCIMLLSLAQIHSETHRQVVRRLFQNGDVNVRAKQHGQTALMLAVSHGRMDMVSLLLEAGADVNIQDEDGSTSLMCASEHGHASIVRMLLAHPDCDTQLTDNDGCTALQVAMEAGHRDVGLLLYAHTNFSRGNSPYSSLRVKRGSSRTSTPGGRASATPPRTPTGTPLLGRRSHSTLH